MHYDKNFAFILDTTLSEKELPALMEGLVLKKRSLAYKHEGKINEVLYSDIDLIDDFNLGKEGAFKILAILKRVALMTLPFFMFTGAFVIGFIGKTIFLLNFSLLTWAVSAIMKIKNFGYQKAFTLSVFAGTAPLIGRDILEMIEIPFVSFVFYVVYFTYIIKALSAIKEQ